MTLPAWHPHLDVWVVLGSVVVAYLIACRRHESRTGEGTGSRQRWLFLGGMGIVWFASGWPMHDLAEGYLYSVHMVQHMLYTLVAAPLLVAGLPAWAWRILLRPAPVAIVFGFLVRPVVAIIAFNGFLLFTHWPAVVEASVASEPLHLGLHVLVVGSALIMWWPVVSPLPERPPIGPPMQMLYLFIQSIAPTIPASFLTFATGLVYPVYGTFPRIWGVSAVTDQTVAGLIMKLAGGLILWAVIGSVFFRWAAREERDGWDALRFRDADAEIRAELSR